jgi:hypothetical protein
MKTIEISGFKMEMTGEKVRRTVEALGETLARLEKVKAKKTNRRQHNVRTLRHVQQKHC